MKSLAIKPAAKIGIPVATDDIGPEKESFPSLTFNPEQAEAAGLDTPTHGQEYDITLHVRVSRIGDFGDEKDKPSVTFDILSAEKAEESPEEEAAEPEEEEPEEPPVKAKGIKSPRESGLYNEEED